MNEATCSIDGCGTVPLARGWCSRHWQRWKRHGDPLGGEPDRPRLPAIDRWWAKVDQSGPIPERATHLGTCWLWTGALSANGYGSFRPDRKSGVGAHRWGWLVVFDQSVPDGYELDHLCFMRNCVNPNHLEPVTPAENKRRGESAAAVNVLKTACPRGHEYDTANTIVRKNGSRQCRACKAAVDARRDRRKKSAA